MWPASLKCYSTSSGTFLCTKTGLSHLSVESAEWHWPWLSAGLTPIAGTLPPRWPSGGSFVPRWLTPSGRSRPPRCARSPGEWCRGRCVPSPPESWRTQAEQLEGKWVVMARGSRRLSARNPCWCLLLTLWSLIPLDFGPWHFSAFTYGLWGMWHTNYSEDILYMWSQCMPFMYNHANKNVALFL